MHLTRLVLALVATISVAVAAPLDVVTIEQRATIAPSSVFIEANRAAKLSSAAYSACLGSAFGVTITLQISNAATDTQGFVGYDSTKKRITVAMRGSTTTQDFLNDVDTTLVTPTLSGVAFPSGVQTMRGVFNPWNSVHNQVIAEVRRLIALYPLYTLESTGHSLGGSLTYLSYIALSQNFPTKSVTSNALAAFPIGNAAFAAFGTAQKGLLRRVNEFGDGVPNMYPQFVHYGSEFYTSGTAATTLACSGQRDLSCSAGNGQIGVTAGHFTNSGVTLGAAGCA